MSPSEERKIKKSEPNKKLIILFVVLGIVILAIGVFGFIFFRNRGKAKMKASAPVMEFDMGGMVNATGTTTTGMLTEELDLSFLETGLLVEEVYLHSQDKVEADTKVLKISEESLNKALLELEREAESADYEYRAQVISAAESEIDAKATYDKAAAKKSYARQTYNDTLRSASATVSNLEKQIADLQEEIDEYTKATSENYYYTYYDVEGKREQYVKNSEYLNQLYEEWDIDNLGSTQGGTSSSGFGGSSGSTPSGTSGTPSGTSGMPSGTGSMPGGTPGGSGSTPGGTGGTSGGSGSMPGGDSGMPSGMGSMSGSSGNSRGMSNDKLTAYELFEAEVEEEGQEYKEALSNYEEKTRLAPYNLQNALTQMEELQAELTQARVDYETTQLQAKLTYDQTVAECDQAQDTYDNEMERIHEELSLVQNDYEEAEENLQYFKEKLGDGYFYTSSAGEVMMVMARANDTLSGESFVMAYTDADSLSVEVSVDQADIAKLYIGESATVSISGYDTFKGRIVAINPITQSSSRSSVYYTVTVELEGDVSSLSQNLTATIIFGADTENNEPSEKSNEEVSKDA